MNNIEEYNNNNFIFCIEYKKLDSLPCKIAGKLVVEEYNNNNFIFCIEYKKLDSLPCKIAGKLVVVGQDKYTNNIY